VTPVDNNTVRYAVLDAQRTLPGSRALREPRRAVALRRLAPGMRILLFTASVLVLLAGLQLFVFTGRTDSFFAFTIANPLAAAFLGAAYWAAVPIEAFAGRQAVWANARIAVPTVFVFTVLTLAVTLTHLGQLHLGARFAAATQIVTVAWIAIYVLVPVLMLILLVVQARTPGTDPPRSAGLPAWLYVVLGVQAIVLLGLGIALFAAPGQAAPLWPWKLTPMMAQATGAWLISLGVAAGHALLERDARRLRPAAAGSILLAVLLAIALARYPHQFEWRSPSGAVYLIFLATMLLTGTVTLARVRRAWPASPSSARLLPGMDVELGHGTRDPETNVTGDDAIMTAKIARAHLNEFPDYYTRLAKIEAEAEAKGPASPVPAPH
jgi:hypothetical protein